MASAWAELKRRGVVKVSEAYAVVAWLLIQIVSNVSPALQLPLVLSPNSKTSAPLDR